MRGNYQLDVSKINGLMREHGITQKELAIHLDIAATSVNNKLTRRTEFTVGEILAIADVFGESPSIFFTTKVERDSKSGCDSRA